MASLAAARAEEAVDALAAAFRDNPINVAVIGDDPERRLRCNRAGMHKLVPEACRHGLALVAEAPEGLGVLLAAPPYAHPFPAGPFGVQLRTLWVQGLRVARRWRQVYEHLQARRPEQPVWMLGTLGVAPPAQGRGLGSALVGELLRCVDADALAVHLETDRPQNLPFYERAGFRVMGETQVLGVRIWHLERPAQPLASNRVEPRR